MIYIIITTSIIHKQGVIDDVHRQRRYIESIQQLLHLVENDIWIKPIIVENNGSRETYLDKLNCEVCYTDNNKSELYHKGLNELMDIKDVITKYDIDDNDIVIKLTGRYKLLDVSYINTVKKHRDQYHAFVKFFNVCEKAFMSNDCVLGLFAIQCKYLKSFQYNYTKSPECEFAEYVRQNIHIDNLMEMDHLHLECCFADNLRLLVV
jgi:hypothetical protein